MKAQPVDSAAQRINYTTCKRSVTSPAVPLTLVNAIAQPGMRNKWMWNNGLSNSAKVVFVSKDSTTRVLGRKLDPSLDRVGMTQDPGEEWVHNFQFWNSLTIPTNVYVCFYVTYWIELSDPILSMST